MNLGHLEAAIVQCDIGQIQFNNGNAISFYFRKKWYPLFAIVNFGKQLANEPKVNTRTAIYELSQILDYTRIRKKEFNNVFPIQANPDMINMEIEILNAIIEDQL